MSRRKLAACKKRHNLSGNGNGYNLESLTGQKWVCISQRPELDLRKGAGPGLLERESAQRTTATYIRRLKQKAEVRWRESPGLFTAAKQLQDSASAVQSYSSFIGAGKQRHCLFKPTLMRS